jgi:hypothetical protein
MIGNLFLTTVNPALDERARLTVPGMADWAEPNSRMRCGDCEFWRDAGDKKPSKVTRRCQKFTALMGGILGPRIPHNTRACKYGAPAKPTEKKTKASVNFDDPPF